MQKTKKMKRTTRVLPALRGDHVRTPAPTPRHRTEGALDEELGLERDGTLDPEPHAGPRGRARDVGDVNLR